MPCVDGETFIFAWLQEPSAMTFSMLSYNMASQIIDHQWCYWCHSLQKRNSNLYTLRKRKGYIVTAAWHRLDSSWVSPLSYHQKKPKRKILKSKRKPTPSEWHERSYSTTSVPCRIDVKTLTQYWCYCWDSRDKTVSRCWTTRKAIFILTLRSDSLLTMATSSSAFPTNQVCILCMIWMKHWGQEKLISTPWARYYQAPKQMISLLITEQQLFRHFPNKLY